MSASELDGFIEKLRRFAVTSTVSGARLALSGPTGSGRRTLVRAVARELDQGVLEVDLATLSQQSGWSWAQLSRLDREATLRGALLLLRIDGVAPPQHTVLARCLNALEAAFVCTAIRVPSELVRGVHGLQVHTVDRLDADRQRQLWSAELGAHRLMLGAADVDSLLSRFDLTPAAIVSAVELLSGRSSGGARRSKAVEVQEVVDSVRGQLDHVLGELADPLETTLDWSDAVLPESVESALKEVMEAGQFKSRVYDEWGFRRKLSYGRGLSCLFSGPPGTGKTMMAAILGHTIGVDVYRIDLSRIASKWVGETEKNLARLFDEAERAQVILLFDEADSLFSRRTSVQSANDRFANMEINFLLQRMESYDGMTILTTNFEESIDEAFKRRIRFHVPFPMPDDALRERLWRSMFPPQVPMASDVDFASLASRFPIAGGAIKNAALRAAFLAAAKDSPLGMKDLERAAVAEAETLGLAIRSYLD